MPRICLYEPALCCETGLCGASPDPELLRITALVARLRKEGAEIGRYNLKSAPMEFIKNRGIVRLLGESGPEGLPAVTRDAEVVISGRYPQENELRALLQEAGELAESATEENHSTGALP